MDPRATAPNVRKADLSELMIAQSRTSKGMKANFCPFGCTDEQLDDQGFCDHLIGITLPDDKSKMERMVKDDRGRRATLGAQTVDVPPGAKLVRITTCHRVYAETKTPEPRAPARTK